MRSNFRIPGRRLFRFPWRTAAQVAADVDEELRFHLDMVAQGLMDEGWPPETAHAEAARRFGDLDGTRKQCSALDQSKETQMRWMQWLEALGQDLRFSFRQLWKSPGFTLVVVLTLALAVGATTAVFSVVHGVLLKPLPFSDPGRLVRVYSMNNEGERDSFSAPNYLDWSRDSRTVSASAAYDFGTANLSGGATEPVRLRTTWVGARFFSVLGVQPRLGRFFTPEEDRPSAAPVAIISEELWRQRFGGSRDVLGTTVDLNRQAYTIVGVAARESQLPSDAQVWVPLVFPDWALGSRGGYYLGVVARLAPGATLDAARAEAKAIGERLAQQYPESNGGYWLDLAPAREVMVGDARTPLLVLLGAVSFVLLIACVNVANLLLVRASSREGEVAVRTALGAGRGRIVRQLLTESLVLALVGGAAGVLLAIGVTRVLIALAPPETPRLAEVGVDGPVLFFALAITLVTGALFGLAPALQASRPDLTATLKEAARGSRGRGATRARNVLVVAEIALAVVLLAGAGLLLRSFARLQKVELGFRPEGIITFNLAPSGTGFTTAAEFRTFVDRLVERLEHLPGVTSAGVGVAAMPLASGDFSLSFTIEGRPPLPPDQEETMLVGLVTPDLLRTMGVPLTRGRAFTARDHKDSPPVVLINEAAARRFFPGENPLGRRIHLGWSENGVQHGGEIVGIVGDFKQTTLDREVAPQLFMPYAQAVRDTLSVAVRTTGDPAALSLSVRTAVREIDPALPLDDLRLMQELVTAATSQARFYMVLLGGFAAIALVLAAVGIYGVIAYAVRQRTHEIGIRMALGATRAGVQRMVVGQGLALAVAGALAGLLLALIVTRWLQSLLYEVSATDPAIYLTVATVLVAVAVFASYLPASRASQTDPFLALRGGA